MADGVFYFKKWVKIKNGNSLLGRVLRKQVSKAREGLGRNARTSFLIVDAQRVNNTDTAENKGCDTGKKFLG